MSVKITRSRRKYPSRHSSSSREATHYTRLSAQAGSTESLESSLSVGSRNRLKQYQRNLSISRGIDQPEFDVQCLPLLKQYARNLSEINSEIEYLANLRCQDGYRFSRNLKIYSTTEDAMERFIQPDHPSFRWNQHYQKSLKQITDMFACLNLKPLSYHSDVDVRNALPKVDTHSGYTWIISGEKYKGENLEGVSAKFHAKAWDAIHRGSFETPILMGFRTQVSGEYEDDGTRTGTGKHKLRVVSMVDLFTIIAELMFAKPIQKFLATQFFYAGGKNPNEISGILTGWRTRYKRFLSIDYSSFDQTISSWLIEDAFKVIKSAFRLSPKQDKLFDVVVHDFIHKDFIISEGVLHSDKGVPSGSMFTQIIDTLVNWIVIQTYFNMIGQQAEMIIMGDDNAIYTNAEVDIEHLASYVDHNFGLIIKSDDKSNEGDTFKKDVKFLSRYWRYDGQWRHPYQLLSRILYPERHRNYDSSVGPEHVIFAFILTYQKGMEELIDTRKFLHDFPISRRYVLENVDSRYLPGALAYIREYT